MQWISPKVKLPNSGEEVLFKYKGFRYYGYFEAMHGSQYFSTASGITADISETEEWLDESSPSFSLQDMLDAYEEGSCETGHQLTGRGEPNVGQDQWFLDKYGIDINKK